MPSQPLLQSDAFLFDIDGTLLNVTDATQYFAFLNAMRETFQVECDLSGIHLHGNTDIGILRAALRKKGISDDDFEGKINRAIEQMCAEVLRKTADIRAVPCSSVGQVLEQLRHDGKLLGVMSGNLEPIGWAKLDAAGIRQFFEFGAFSAHLSPNGSDPAVPLVRFERRADILAHAISQVHERLGREATICLLGDTPSDIHAARELGIPVIAVATGTFSRDQLEPLAPDFCCDCLDELLV
jgi:phosphoglycolate phosphatase-like HAD superfamily hydrolase